MRTGKEMGWVVKDPRWDADDKVCSAVHSEMTGITWTALRATARVGIRRGVVGDYLLFVVFGERVL